MTELEEKIKKLADAYYQGNELVTDYEYDSLIELLKQTQPNSELLKNGVIGSDVNQLKGISKKYKLPITMGTLSKCMNIPDFQKWWETHDHTNLVLEEKIDGAGACIEYRNGKLIQILSRGDSEYGEDITENASKIPNIVSQFASFTGFVRGEMVMFKTTFEQHFAQMKNPRNACAGIIKRLDGKGCDKLNFIAYDLFDPNNTNDSLEINKLEFLKNNGFSIPCYLNNPTYDDVIEWRNKVTEDNEYPRDGIVLKQNIVNKEDLARHTPLNNVAVKPEHEVALTRVVKIRWQLAGSIFSPVVDVNPVELYGTTVEHATVANINVMNELGIYEGAEVHITKAGMIIPQIVDVVNPKTNAFEIPSICPICNGQVKVNSSGMPICINPNCPRKVGHRFKKMFKVFDIKGAGDAFVQEMEDCGITIQEFLQMCKTDDKTILNQYAGGINGEKVYSQMQDIMAKPISVAEFLATFDFKAFDEKKIRQIGNKSLDEILSITIAELTTIDGFADTTATAFKKYLNDNKEEINALRKFFIFEDITSQSSTNTATKGKVCFTGSAPISRNELTEKAEAAGWIVQSAVNKETTILACADPNSGSSKLQKAKANGTQVISYEDFIENYL